MKITEKETQKSTEIASPFNGEDFLMALRNLVPFERSIDQTYVVESFSKEDTSLLLFYLMGGDTAETIALGLMAPDLYGESITIHTPFTGRLEIFNKF